MTLRRVVLASRPTRVRILSCEAGTAPAEEISWAATCAKVGLALTVIPVLVGLGLNAAQRAFGSDFMPWEGLLLPLFLLPIVGIILLIQSAALIAAVTLVPAIVLGCWFWGAPVCSRME